MATKLKSFEFRRTNTIYPWDKWADGSIWQVKRGVDFEVNAASFRAGLAPMATRLSMKVRTSLKDDTVTFQFYKPE